MRIISALFLVLFLSLTHFVSISQAVDNQSFTFQNWFALSTQEQQTYLEDFLANNTMAVSEGAEVIHQFLLSVQSECDEVCMSTPMTDILLGLDYIETLK